MISENLKIKVAVKSAQFKQPLVNVTDHTDELVSLLRALKVGMDRVKCYYFVTQVAFPHKKNHN